MPRNAQASIKIAAYNQIMSLSRDFHTEKQSGELYKSIEQGRSITGLLEVVALQILPLFTDVVVAFSYLYSHYFPVITNVSRCETRELRFTQVLCLRSLHGTNGCCHNSHLPLDFKLFH